MNNYATIITSSEEFGKARFADTVELANAVTSVAKVVDKLNELCREYPRELKREGRSISKLRLGIQEGLLSRQPASVALFIYRHVRAASHRSVDNDFREVQAEYKDIRVSMGATKTGFDILEGWDGTQQVRAPGAATYRARRAYSQHGHSPYGHSAPVAVPFPRPARGGTYMPPRGGGYRHPRGGVQNGGAGAGTAASGGGGSGGGAGRGAASGAPARGPPKCRSCTTRGAANIDHSHADCPFVKCFRCNQTGHIIQHCPN